MSEFKIPPVSTLIGSTFGNYLRVIKRQHISSKYYFKIFLTTLVVVVSTPFHWWENLIYNKKRLKKLLFKKPPLFILGHWRSGTTLLHNMLCQDPSSGYITTYQSVFPNNMASKLLFRTFMKANMPDKRPSDNIKLDVSFPQEDGFAFNNMNHNTYYSFFYFPSQYKKFYDKGIRHKGLSDKEKRKWYFTYDKLLKKAMLNTNGKRMIIKNPVNTSRIKQLLKLYPEAKFLFIYRNPVTVFLSTQRFFHSIFPTLQLQNTTKEFIDNMIIDVYKMIMDDYFKQKKLIPPENLLELKYENFEKNPVEELKLIYNNLLKDDFENVKEHFSDYFKSLKGHKKNKYEVEKEKIDLIVKHWGKYMDLLGYNIPDEIIIK
jgi:hypothetical protein